MHKALLITFCTGVSTWLYITLSLVTCKDCFAKLMAIVNESSQAPFAYRLLTPDVLVALGNTPVVWIAFWLVMIAVFFSLLWTWVSCWNGNPALAVGLTTAALSLMLPTYGYSVYTVTEWVLWLFGLLLLTRWPFKHKFLIYALLVVAGTLNREMTAVLLLLAWFALADFRRGVALGGLAAGTYGFIRIIVGYRPNGYTLAYVFSLNTQAWFFQQAVMYIALLLPLIIIGMVGLRRAPLRLRRLALVVLIVYLPLWALWAMWSETRLLMPVLILFLPQV